MICFETELHRMYYLSLLICTIHFNFILILCTYRVSLLLRNRQIFASYAYHTLDSVLSSSSTDILHKLWYIIVVNKSKQIHRTTSYLPILQLRQLRMATVNGVHQSLPLSKQVFSDCFQRIFFKVS